MSVVPLKNGLAMFLASLRRTRTAADASPPPDPRLAALIAAGALRPAAKAEYDAWIRGFWYPRNERVRHYTERWNGRYGDQPILTATRDIALTGPLSSHGTVMIIVPEGVRITWPESHTGFNRLAGGAVVLLDMVTHRAADPRWGRSLGMQFVGVWSDTALMPARRRTMAAAGATLG